MGQRSTCHPATLLLSVIIAAASTCGQAQLLDTSDVFSTSAFGLRRLSAYFPRNFEALNPQKCYSSSYFSPYRLYFMDLTFTSFATAEYSFQLDVAACPVSRAYCCGQALDHLVIRTAPTAQISGVEVDGQPVSYNVTVHGLTIFDLNIDPTPQKSVQISVFAPADGYQAVSALCPKSRVPDSCDAITYNLDETCCAERAALPYGLFFPPAPPPPGNVSETTGAPPRPPSPPRPPPKQKPPPPSPSPSPPPSPPPPSPPPPPPPPPPDGYDICCIDDLPKSPFNVKYNGWKRTGSDTAYQFQLYLKDINATYPDFDAPEKGDCSAMNLRDLGISIYDDLLVKSVSFNGSIFGYRELPSAEDPASKWIYLDLFMQMDDFDPNKPIDIVITVRGRVNALCPANEFLHSTAACEFAMHGRDGTSQCCPHGATKRQGPPDDCCVDDIEKAPYRMQFLRSNAEDQETVFDFAIKVADVTGIDYDLEEPAACNTMTLDYAQIQIYKNIEVLEVKWEERVMTFNTTPATDYSKWLNINDINRFIYDFDQNMPTRFTVKVRGYVREPCPVGWLLDAGGAAICEYVLHGTQGLHSCCPHGISETGSIPETCGCRDDVAETPYRIGYTPLAASTDQTIFTFNLATVDPKASIDFDNKPDMNFGAEVTCGAMSIKSIAFAVPLDLKVEEVVFKHFAYDFQFEPYTSTSKWLKVLDIDYNPSDFADGEAVPLSILVDGVRAEMCTAGGLYGSQASCEYLIYGLDNYQECCPRGMSTWSELLGLPASS